MRSIRICKVEKQEYSKSIDKRYAKDIDQVTGKRLTCNRNIR